MPTSTKMSSEAEGGTYVVLVDRLRQEVFADNDQVKKEPVDELIYEKGEDVELDAREAARHIAGGAVAKDGTLQAQVARGLVPAEFVPNPALTNEQLEVQLAAIQQVLRERDHGASYDVSAEGGVDPTDPEAVAKAQGKSDSAKSADQAKSQEATQNAKSSSGAKASSDTKAGSAHSK